MWTGIVASFASTNSATPPKWERRKSNNDAKSNHDRITFLPDDAEFVEHFTQHLERWCREHETAPRIPASMPLALERKYRSAAKSWDMSH